MHKKKRSIKLISLFLSKSKRSADKTIFNNEEKLAPFITKKKELSANKQRLTLRGKPLL